MKFKIFIIALFMCLFQFNNAQNSSLLNFGINTDFITIPLTENSILSNNTVVNIGYNLNDNLNCKIGYEGSVIKKIKKINILTYLDL